jgi:hypothetical protein
VNGAGLPTEEARHAPLPFPHLRGAPPVRRRAVRPPLRLVPPHPRPRRRALHRSARPLRPHAVRGGFRLAGLQGRRERPLGMGRAHRRPRAHPARGHREPRAAHRRGRGLYRRPRGAGSGGRAAAAGLRRPGVPGGDAAAVPLPRSAPGEAARQHHEARRDHRLAPPPDARGRVLRVPDPDPDGLVSRGCPRLPRAVPGASGQILRAPAGAAAVQAADDDRGLRPLLPDRAVLPRRGCPGRPLAGRVLPARHRDELRHPGGRVPGGGAGPARRVRGVRRGQARHQAVPADHLRGLDAEIRSRQAGPAQPVDHRGRHRSVRPRGRGVQGVQGRDRRRRRGPGDPGHRGGGAAALVLRQAQ